MITVNQGSWGSKTFDNESALLVYLTQLEAFYTPFIQYMPQSQGAFHNLRTAKSQLDTYVLNREQYANHLTSALSALDGVHQQQGGLPPVDSSDGKFIATFAKNPELAGKIAAQLAVPPNVTTDTQAALIATAYRYPKLAGKSGFTFAEAAADSVRLVEQKCGDADRLLQEARVAEEALFETLFQQVAKQLHEARDEAGKQRDGIKNEWAALKDVYDKDLALQAPRKYWTRQLKSHRSAARRGKCWLLGGAAVTVIVVGVWLKLMWWVADSTKIADIPLSIWLITGALVGIGFWVVRLLSRLYLSSEHLSRDAEERVTMIETYLALKKGNHVSNEDLRFVLAALFRPTEDGLVKDDGLPAPLAELFQASKPNRN
jgi:Family of unknown function (DUF6161)